MISVRWFQVVCREKLRQIVLVFDRFKSEACLEVRVLAISLVLRPMLSCTRFFRTFSSLFEGIIAHAAEAIQKMRRKEAF